MRLALFAPYLPEPPMTGGRIRIHHLAEPLIRRHEVHLFAVAAGRELNDDVVKALDRFASWHIGPSRWGFLPGRSMPARVHNGVAASPAAAFRRLDKEQPFDALWVEHVHAARIAATAGRPWLLDEHNIESDYLRDKQAARGRPGRLARREVALLSRWEQTQWQQATQVVCVTEADAARVAETRDRRPALIPNGVDLRRVSFRLPSARKGGTILFVGLMNHPPNERAATFLVQSVMPAVWAEHPDARVVLCGANPSRSVLALAGPRVEVTGTVDAVTPYLEAAAVFAFPLFHGAGSSLKVLESLAAGIPLVASEVAVRGFALSRDTHYWAAADAGEFSSQLCGLLWGAADADRRATEGRRVAEGYDWAALADRFAAQIDGLIS